MRAAPTHGHARSLPTSLGRRHAGRSALSTQHSAQPKSVRISSPNSATRSRYSSAVSASRLVTATDSSADRQRPPVLATLTQVPGQESARLPLGVPSAPAALVGQTDLGGVAAHLLAFRPQPQDCCRHGPAESSGRETLRPDGYQASPMRRGAVERPIGLPTDPDRRPRALHRSRGEAVAVHRTPEREELLEVLRPRRSRVARRSRGPGLRTPPSSTRRRSRRSAVRRTARRSWPAAWRRGSVVGTGRRGPRSGSAPIGWPTPGRLRSSATRGSRSW